MNVMESINVCMDEIVNVCMKFGLGIIALGCPSNGRVGAHFCS